MASMCKLKAGRLARELTDSCMQFWVRNGLPYKRSQVMVIRTGLISLLQGGMGYTDECIVTRFYRDFRLLSIGAGADEIMLGIICKFMDILPKPEKK